MGVTINEDRWGVISQSITPSAVATITAPAQTFTVPGLTTDMLVYVVPPGQQAGVTIGSCRVSAANTLSIQFVNPTAGSVTPTAGAHLIWWFRPEKTSTTVLV